MPVYEYKLEKALDKKNEVEEFEHKKNIFLLHR
jgi:hypothetical protein